MSNLQTVWSILTGFCAVVGRVVVSMCNEFGEDMCCSVCVIAKSRKVRVRVRVWFKFNTSQ